MLRRIVMLSILATLLVGAAGIWREAGLSFGQQKIVDIDIRGFAFQPLSKTISVGTTVRWTNRDIAPHTSTSDDGIWDSDILNQGESFSYTFDEEGTFSYVCTVHPFMAPGEIIVE